MKITNERIKNVIGSDGCAFIIGAVEKKYIFAMTGHGDVIKLACEQGMIEDEYFNKLMKKAWSEYNRIIISN
jgi:hypothetical protein